MKGVEVVAKILKQEGAEYFFCYPNHSLIEACAKEGIRPILCRQERVGMAIADGFSRTTNGKRIGVFAMQQGPGAENAFPGAAQAFSDCVPILLLPAGVPTNRSFISPEFFATDNYANVTKWQASVNYVERIPDLMRKAYYQLKTGKGGPVLLELPIDVLDAEFEGEIGYKVVNGNKFSPDRDEIREIVKILLNAKRPVIHAGQGCMYADSTDELLKFAEILDAPVMTTLPGKSSFPENHPLSLGASAVSSTKPVVNILNEADVVFGIGTSFTKTGYGKSIPNPSEKIMIHSTNDIDDINTDYQSDYSLVGDAKLTLQSLIDEIKIQSSGKGRVVKISPSEQVKKLKTEWLSEWDSELNSEELPMNQYRVITELMKNVDVKNTIVTHDAGSPRDQVVPFWQSIVPRTYIGWGKSTQLGYGLGLIMGAKLAEPEKLCINIMGDAAIGMVGMDLETAVRNKIGILTIVFNNGVMAIERNTMPYAHEKYGTLVEGGDYAKVADALGVWSRRVKTPEEFVIALNEAKNVTASGRPVLLDCVVKEGYKFSHRRE
jgi:acetolactate synthase-1/2/3 large subunit